MSHRWSILGAFNCLGVGEENLVTILRTSSPSHLMGYLILASPNLCGQKLLLQIKDVQILIQLPFFRSRGKT